MEKKIDWNALQQQAMMTQFTLEEYNKRIERLEKRISRKDERLKARIRKDKVRAKREREAKEHTFHLDPQLYHGKEKNKFYQKKVKEFEEYKDTQAYKEYYKDKKE